MSDICEVLGIDGESVESISMSRNLGVTVAVVTFRLTAAQGEAFADRMRSGTRTCSECGHVRRLAGSSRIRAMCDALGLDAERVMRVTVECTSDIPTGVATVAALVDE